jgi:hypothetical protein
MNDDGVVDALQGGHDEQTAGLGQLGPNRGVLEHVLGLRRAVEGELGEALVHRADDAQRMLHTVEEVGVAERKVAGTHLDETLDVVQEDVGLHDPDAPVVDRGHRAVAAAVHAAVARLDVADQALLVAEQEAGVALQRREKLARGKLKALAAEIHDLCSRRIASLSPREATHPCRASPR